MAMTYQQMKDLLSSVDGPVEKLELVMDFGAHIPTPPDNSECSVISGCASYVEICRTNNHFFGKADSALVRGIVALLTSMVDGRTPQEIKKMDLLGEFSTLGLNLGAGRMNGLNSMIRFLQNL